MSGAIGVFDSGLGGLTVLKSLMSALPNEDFVYLGDTARLPYGAKSPQTIQLYLKQNIEFLKNYNVKAIVVACNSASSVLKQESFTELPVWGVIEPGAMAALRATKNKKVAVIGTRATISQASYVEALQRLDKNIEVFQQACPLFVPIVEEGLYDDPLTNLIVYRYLNPLRTVDVDTLILGCTHYPLLKTPIKKVLPFVELIDSSKVIAEQLKAHFPQTEMEHTQKVEILCTDNTAQFQAMVNLVIGGDNFMAIQKVDI
ncbi:MAG: glutamate racemase [Bdellovibrionales bacterium]|nr:glutamate racemase [Bdellovibrionales bacterium]